VFVVEQNAPYQDADGKDQHSFHLMGYSDSNELIAYARIIPKGIAFEEVSIGRVVTSQKGRRIGAGKELVKNAIQLIKKQYGDVPIRIGAQCYLKKFYSNFGFQISGEEYIEDTLPHVEMIYSPN
jgi:ElaA protein